MWFAGGLWQGERGGLYSPVNSWALTERDMLGSSQLTVHRLLCRLELTDNKKNNNAHFHIAKSRKGPMTRRFPGKCSQADQSEGPEWPLAWNNQLLNMPIFWRPGVKIHRNQVTPLSSQTKHACANYKIHMMTRHQRERKDLFKSLKRTLHTYATPSRIPMHLPGRWTI